MARLGPLVQLRRHARFSTVSAHSEKPKELSLIDIKWHNPFCHTYLRVDGACLSCGILESVKHDEHQAMWNGGIFFWRFKKEA